MLAVFMVDNLADTGLGSLRQAILDANANVGADVVEFQAGLSGTIALSTGELAITDDLTIDGPRAADLTIDAQQGSRIFHITPASGPVTIDRLTLTGGIAPGSGGAIFSGTSEPLSITASTISGNSAAGAFFVYGGGIYSYGNVTVTDSTISGNSADGGVSAGGGIAADGEVTVTNSTISGNSATGGQIGAGGGIASRSEVTVIGGTISDNSATGDYAGNGGGIRAVGDVTVSGSTIWGNSASGDQFAQGGGIAATGDVTLTDSTISGNSASDGDRSSRGGGIFAGGDVTVTSSTISGNSATSLQTGYGGGIFSFNNVTVTDSTISGNSADGGGYFGAGGGIFANGATITSSTISGNVATAGEFAVGGGVDSRGDVTVSSSTISGNSASSDYLGRGGGINAAGAVTVANSTISGNSATGGSSFPGGGGGGIFVSRNPLTIKNSIVAGNQTNTGTAPDLRSFTGPLSVSYSLIGDNTDTGLAPAPVGMPDADGNLIGTAASPIDPLLGPLQANDGPTETHALLAGSPAINAGDPLFAPPLDFDQRGDPFVRVSGGRIDMGAFELQPATLDEKIQQLLDTGVLNRGHANSLLVKLNPAGNERAQLNRLRTFINEVNALVRAGILSSEEGQCLIEGAERLRNDLSVDAVLASMASSERSGRPN